MTTPSRQAPLSGAERKYLRSLAHHLRPLVYIGKTGLTPSVLAAIDQALERHELIKLRFQDGKDIKQQLAQTIAQESHSEIIGAVGHVYMFYRQHPNVEKRQIRLERRGATSDTTA